MLIVNDEHCLRAGIKSLSKRCSYCSKPLEEYPLIMNDDAGFHVFHAACAAALAIDIQVDLCTFFNPPAPYPPLFVLTPPIPASRPFPSADNPQPQEVPY